jgi:hypothetical protein
MAARKEDEKSWIPFYKYRTSRRQTWKVGSKYDCGPSDFGTGKFWSRGLEAIGAE